MGADEWRTQAFTGVGSFIHWRDLDGYEKKGAVGRRFVELSKQRASGFQCHAEAYPHTPPFLAKETVSS